MVSFEEAAELAKNFSKKPTDSELLARQVLEVLGLLDDLLKL